MDEIWEVTGKMWKYGGKAPATPFTCIIHAPSRRAAKKEANRMMRRSLWNTSRHNPDFKGHVGIRNVKAVRVATELSYDN